MTVMSACASVAPRQTALPECDGAVAIACVNGRVISLETFQAELDKVFMGQRFPDDLLHNGRITLEWIVARIREQAEMDKLVAPHVKVSREEALDFYEKNEGSYREQSDGPVASFEEVEAQVRATLARGRFFTERRRLLAELSAEATIVMRLPRELQPLAHHDNLDAALEGAAQALANHQIFVARSS